MFVKHRFKLDSSVTDDIRSMTPNFGYNGFGELVFWRTYSRQICDICRSGLKYKEGKDYCPNCGSAFGYGQESWHDCVIRVVQGVFSIRKDWYIRNHINWDEDFWQHYARHFAISMFNMEWLPPGRGLWAMGTDFVYERGSMALQNCGLTLIGEDIGADINWMMDALMCGVGVGFVPVRDDDLRIYVPHGSYDYVIPDTREGWCDATEALINCYLKLGLQKPKMIYDQVRPAGQPIRGFGGISSGPDSLRIFHEQIETFMDMYITHDWYDSFLLKTDLANCAGCCVVAGNVRRSAELCAGEIDDLIDLKDYAKYPYREAHGWMSNNSVFLKDTEDFERLGEIAERIINNGEPGFINLKTLPFGRLGKFNDGLRLDKAIAFNPCGEQPLENKELCTLVETVPTRCKDTETWIKACEYATVYATTVTLLSTHRPETNAVMLRNRRIGVSIMDVAGWVEDTGVTKLIKNLRAGYNKVRATSKWTNTEAGIPLPIRNTTVKPGGTTPKLPGVRSGWSWPTFGLTLRRINIAQNSPVYKLLHEAGVPHEPSVTSAGTEIFEWPIDQSDNERIKPATDVSLYEQAMMLALLQSEWSDNAVSNTLYFKPKWGLVHNINIGESFYIDDLDDDVLLAVETALPISYEDLIDPQEFENDSIKVKLEQDKWTNNWFVKVYHFNPGHEEDDVEHVLASLARQTKSVAMLPHSEKGVYRQSPEEGITRKEYEQRLAAIRPIDWSRLRHSDGLDEKYCEGPSCEIKR